MIDFDNLPWATVSGKADAERYAAAGNWTAVWEVLHQEGALNDACMNPGKADVMYRASEKALALR